MTSSKKEKACAPQQQANSNNKQANFNSASAYSQRQRLVAALKIRAMTTLQIRRELDILGVAPRIFELKARGYKIITHWVHEATDSGKIHRVANYILLSESEAV